MSALDKQGKSRRSMPTRDGKKPATPWSSVKAYGSSHATVRRSEAMEGDAASDNSEQAIVVKRTIDVDVR